MNRAVDVGYVRAVNVVCRKDGNLIGFLDFVDLAYADPMTARFTGSRPDYDGHPGRYVGVELDTSEDGPSWELKHLPWILQLWCPDHG